MILNKQVVNELRKEYGDAFYLLDSEQYRNNFLELRDTFRKIYPNFNIAYSYKTNYTPKFCKIVNELGGYAEVVSEMELEIALRVGVKPNRIIWNGPIKNPKKLEEFLVAGGTGNIDSVEELEVVKNIAERHPDKKLNLGIRCNYEVNDGVVSRFGYDVDSEGFKKVLAFVTSTPNVHFINFQCHFAKRQIEYWPARANGMVELIDRLGIIPDRIDIGGGLFGKMADSLKAQFTNEIPDYQAYAEAAARVFAEYFADKDVKPELLIEPGSAVVGDCMKFVGTVKTIKNVRGKWFATILGSQKNISMTGINPPMEVIAMGGEQKEYDNLDMVGFTCIEGDVLYHNYNGKLAHEDAIVISNCGSYSLVMKPPFILPNFPVLDICGAKTEVIKRGEVFDDLFHTFNF
ncbi:pyridoxal-dependent decarboxylase [Prevotella pectinovora]|uniref:Pyridoxal-dependent decarboxylase n=1 Tax=Prevotella pectinovora TaxID=1602169 RepID=A0A0D0IW12_9BACT|nr:pyridoxal-dependent decarboxylase [Prevotella pectinovora]KIP62512.1 pyridoxal-dependent decarboxylase [Prevotella pectinovora]